MLILVSSRIVVLCIVLLTIEFDVPWYPGSLSNYLSTCACIMIMNECNVMEKVMVLQMESRTLLSTIMVVELYSRSCTCT